MQFIGTGDRILTENFNVGYLYTITFKTGIYINSACIGIGDTFVMFQKAEPDLLFTLNVDTADEVDTIELYDSGGGTNDYDDLVNRPRINSHTLTGNMSGADLGLQNTISDLDTIRAGAAAGATAVQPAALSYYQPVISDLDTIRAGAAAGATAVQPADMTSALAAKQDALSTAQLAAVNSGITSTDVAQITTNKNSISYLENTGKKNWLKPDTISGVPTGITIQYESDDSITINGTYSGSDYAYVFLHSFTHEAMQYTLSCNVETLASKYYFYTRDGHMQSTQTLVYTYTDSDTTRIVMRIAPNTSFSNVNVKLMIRPSIITDSTYQPYSPSNRELYEMILALQ